MCVIVNKMKYNIDYGIMKFIDFLNSLYIYIVGYIKFKCII